MPAAPAWGIGGARRVAGDLAPCSTPATAVVLPTLTSRATGEPQTVPPISSIAMPLPQRPPAVSPPTWINAPSIQLAAPIVPVAYQITRLGDQEATAWEVPDDAAGFHSGTAYPGNPGNTVLSGHHNAGSQVFRYLVDLDLGDLLIVYVDKTPYRYRVVHKEIVREIGVSDEVRRENGKWIAPSSDERLTLVTCWPYTGNSHRLIIVARPVS